MVGTVVVGDVGFGESRVCGPVMLEFLGLVMGKIR